MNENPNAINPPASVIFTMTNFRFNFNNQIWTAQKLRTLFQPINLPTEQTPINDRLLTYWQFPSYNQCRINYGSGGLTEPGPLNSGSLTI